MKVLLDTNFLIDVIRFKIDLESIEDLILKPYSLATLSSVVNELTKISKGRSKSSENAKIALQLINEYKIEILKSKGKVDEAMIELSKNKALIATNDRVLRKVLKGLGKKTIYLKSKKHLAIG